MDPSTPHYLSILLSTSQEFPATETNIDGFQKFSVTMAGVHWHPASARAPRLLYKLRGRAHKPRRRGHERG